jgi:DNA-binding Lrp family transcriptional regulator
MEKLTLRKRITDLLHIKGALNAVDISKELDVEKRKIVDALHGLKKREVIKPIGKRPWLYVIRDKPVSVLEKPVDINKFTGITGKIVTLIANHKESPLNAREIAERVDIGLSNARYFLSTLKRRGILKAIGSQPWHYAINEDPLVSSSEKKSEKPQKKKKIKTLGIECPDSFFLIVYTLKGSKEPYLRAFKDSESEAFITTFEKLQDNEYLDAIAGFKKLKCVTKIIMSPKVTR